MNGYIPLGYGDLAIAALLVLANAALSLVLQLGIHRRLLVAAIRMVLQLALMGVVLHYLFLHVSPWLSALAGAVMVGFAGREAVARQDRQLQGWWSLGIGTASMGAAALLITSFALLTALRPDPWYDARYAIPLLGMVLGNTMNGVSLGLNNLTNGLYLRRPAVEAQIMLGASRFQALRPILKDSLRNGLMPTVNSMSATGLVSIPGMMTGQMLGGVAPGEAVKYQILIMFLIAGSTGVGVVCAVVAGIFRLTDHRHRLRLDRLRQRS